MATASRAMNAVATRRRATDMWLFVSLAAFVLLWIMVSPLTCCQGPPSG